MHPCESYLFLYALRFVKGVNGNWNRYNSESSWYSIAITILQSSFPNTP